MASLQTNSDSRSLTCSGAGKDWIVSNQRFDTLADAQNLAMQMASSDLTDTPVYEKVYVAQAPILPKIQIIPL